MIYGNTQGIRRSTLEQLEAFYDMQMASDLFAPQELVRRMANFTHLLGREIVVYLGRENSVLHVGVGESDKADVPEVRVRRSLKRLSGVRCLHTHPSSDSTLSEPDISALRNLMFDAMAAIGVEEDGRAGSMHCAFLGELDESGQYSVHIERIYSVYDAPQEAWMHRIYIAEREVDLAQPIKPEKPLRERAVLLGLANNNEDESLKELARLADTAGADVMNSVSQNHARPDAATYVGSGKALEVAQLCRDLECTMIIVNDELTGAQVKNLEQLTGLKVVDRTALILDIFAQHARTREGRLQVELAQLQYQLPRLMGQGMALSRLGGGIGTRGPGETQLEVDRRVIRRRIRDIQKEIEKVKTQRDVRRVRREKAGVPIVALVGYTNSGKSTLLNCITGSDVLVEDKLFATLDTTTRKAQLPRSGECLFIDTVGFIDKLPHDLVDAFRSTLEEALVADLVLEVLDASSSAFTKQREVVNSVLGDLKYNEKKRLVAINKIDIAQEMPYIPVDAVPISALTGEGVNELLAAVDEALSLFSHEISLVIPYDRGDCVAFLHRNANVLGEEYVETGTRISARISMSVQERLMRLLAQEK